MDLRGDGEVVSKLVLRLLVLQVIYQVTDLLLSTLLL